MTKEFTVAKLKRFVNITWQLNAEYSNILLKQTKLSKCVYAHEVSLARVEWVREKNVKRMYKFASVAQG